MADETWSVAEAKAKFSEVVERARHEGPQRVTRNGKDAVVVVSADTWRQLSAQSGRTFVDALLDPMAGVLTEDEAGRLFARDTNLGRSLKL